MISIEEIRQGLIGTLDTVHDTYYPTITINYPNKFKVDLENYNKSFFVTVSINFGSSIKFSDISSSDLDITGDMKITAVTKYGSGTKDLTEYIDDIISNFVVPGVEGVAFSDMRVLTSSPYPGYHGEVLFIKFRAIK